MGDFPSGTVTFLFTDMEGSTALWEQDRKAMATAVERHLALLDAAIQAHGGTPYKTVGDAVQAAFTTAPQAVAAAVDGQRALLTENWGDLGPLRVRMALHTGEAVPRGGDYLAAPLNRLARVLGVARGGQILLTEAVEQLVQDALPLGASLRDLGEVHLRGLERPERIFVLGHPELPRDAALPTSLNQQGRHFPASLTPFLGRESEVTTVVILLQEPRVRLLTLTGPGGTGKTRLALEAGIRVAHDFTDGAVFIDLAPLRDPALVLSEVATKLGLREVAGRALRDVVHDFLREREMLLIVDNFEHLLDAAPSIAELLTACPRVKALVTSRASLRLRGERECAVPTLDLPNDEDLRDLQRLAANEAVGFFVDRTQAVRSDFVLTPENAPTIAAICARLDGLPLALELAAARVKILPPHTLLARLGARLPLLTGGTRDAPQRQRTLRDAIAWSHDLLSSEECRLFRRLGVFFGGWTLEAAEAVANVEGDLDVLEGLASLADESLVRLEERGAEPRYGMLETIREFAVDQLAASGEATALRDVHAAYFLNLAEQAKPHLYGAGQRPWLRRLEAEHPNLRAALEALATSDDHEAHLRLAANLGLFWWMRAHFVEGRAHLERALERTVAPTRHGAEALTGIGRIATTQGDFAAAQTWLQQGEALARALNVPAVLWQALFERGLVAEWEGDDERAVPLYESALAVARELNDAQAVGSSLYALGDCAYRRGDLDTAERLAAEAVTAARAAGDEFVLSLALDNIGQAALARGDTPRAIVAYQEALDLALGIGVDYAVANALAGFAAVAAMRGDYAGAAELLGATEIVREASHQDRLPNYAHHAQTMQAVRTALGESAFTAAWDAGRALSVDEAITFVLRLGLR